MRIKDIEKRLYPEHMLGITSESAKGLAEYCECSLDELCVLRGENWYSLLAIKEDYVEIADLAALPGNEFAASRAIMLELLKHKGKVVFIDARESTSYPMVKRAEEKGRIEILKDELYYWEGVPMHEMEFVIL